MEILERRRDGLLAPPRLRAGAVRVHADHRRRNCGQLHGSPDKSDKNRVKPVVFEVRAGAWRATGTYGKQRRGRELLLTTAGTATQLTRSATAPPETGSRRVARTGGPRPLTPLVSHAIDPGRGRQTSERRACTAATELRQSHHRCRRSRTDVPREPMDSPAHERVHARSPEACSVDRRRPTRVIVMPMCPRPSSVRVRTSRQLRRVVSPGNLPFTPWHAIGEGDRPRGRARRRLFAPPSYRDGSLRSCTPASRIVPRACPRALRPRPAPLRRGRAPRVSSSAASFMRGDALCAPWLPRSPTAPQINVRRPRIIPRNVLRGDPVLRARPSAEGDPTD